MIVKKYRDFELVAEDVETDDEGVLHFTVRVFSSPAGEGKRTPRQCPPDLRKRLSKLERRELDVAGVIDLGETLAELLLPEEARDLFESVLYNHIFEAIEKYNCVRVVLNKTCIHPHHFEFESVRIHGLLIW